MTGTQYHSHRVAERRFDGAVRVNALTTGLINRLQAEAPSEVRHTSCRDEGTSKTTEEKEGLEADNAEHTFEEYTEMQKLETHEEKILYVGGGFIGVERMTELEHCFPQMKLEIIDFLPRCLGSVSDGTADCCSEYMSASGIKEVVRTIPTFAPA